MNDSASISTIGERGLIDRIRARLGPAPAFVRIGIGDDAAVIVNERGTQTVVTTDSLIEGVHFRREWSPPEAIGHKALAVNLSDLAAMGATPRAALLSLAMPADFPLADFDALVDGFLALASSSGTALIGGNIARSPAALVADVTAIGHVHPRRILQRTGARPGDLLFVTGVVGAAAVGLAILTAGAARESLSPAERAAVDRLERPDPRLRLASIVARTAAATAAIDLSDGLADAARRLAEAAGLGIVIDAGHLPLSDAARPWLGQAEADVVRRAVSGGEDYELAFVVPPRRRSRFMAAVRRCPGVVATEVGIFQKDLGAWVRIGTDEVSLRTEFDHF